MLSPENTPLPETVQGWLELDKKYRIKGRYDISQILVKGEGVLVWDADGRAYIDFESGQVCASTGHCHPAYTASIVEQAAKLVQTGSRYTNPPRILLARKLANIMPGNLSRECGGHDHPFEAIRPSCKWFAIVHFDVTPDIITTSKSMGGGVPLCAVTTTPEIADSVAELGYHQPSSHTDDPFLVAVGLANMESLERRGLAQNAEVMGRYLKDEFERMQANHEILGDIRGFGLTIGLEIVIDRASKAPSPLHASAISEYCHTHGLLLGHRPSGAVSGNGIRILPPLILTRTEADEGVLILRDAFVHAEKTVEARGADGTSWM
ncbi:Alanine--glyoxylate aminotransferase-like protein [Hapsidospora chrysogenum ATCC 11550]|uniref:Alanine--glyoxylate aminotransferase-like protein n=1 Tax=Hapsidospora chrysogenum (strain ATCC 11550 / CBS 779.69 / DSM 880 / IAM 14645 / JCM 23072 / IMI 49137) TaxID=857340 RepID=A0A086TCK9_HAPC1|nr:Alanine--glyoxylate aminotransferase-like protein [Hapsidospora chrysogenum ATCC 11550]